MMSSDMTFTHHHLNRTLCTQILEFYWFVCINAQVFPYQDPGYTVSMSVWPPPPNDGPWSRIIVSALCSVSPGVRREGAGRVYSVSHVTPDSVHTPPQECDAGLVVTLLLPTSSLRSKSTSNREGKWFVDEFA